MTVRNSTAFGFGLVSLVIGVLVLIMGRPPTGNRDADGYYIDEPFRYDRASRAIVTADIDILRGVYGSLSDDAFVLYITADPVDLRIQGTASGSTALFIGVAPSSAVDEYLAGVDHHEITDLDRHSESKQIRDVQYTAHEGTRVPNPPGTETFWAGSTDGIGLQNLDWTVESGDEAAVVMNADASPGVMAELAFGAAPSTNVDVIGRASLIAGVMLLIGGGLLLYVGLRRGGRDSPTTPADVDHDESVMETTPQDQPLLGG